MIGAIACKPLNYSDFLYKHNKSLLLQSNAVKGRYQKDGWGIGYYDNKGRIHLLKRPGFAAHEKKMFQRSADFKSRIFIAHIRAASNPGKIPKRKLIGKVNSQPFCFEDFLFAHNGTLCIFEEVKSRLGKYTKYIRSRNDSEVLFWQTIKMMDAYGSIEKALPAVADEIETIWKSVKNYSKFEYPYKGLNILFADGKNLYAMIKRVHESQKQSLMTPTWDFWDMALLENKNSVLISSEPVNGEKWKKIKSPALVKIHFTNRKLKIKVKNV